MHSNAFFDKYYNILMKDLKAILHFKLPHISFFYIIYYLSAVTSLRDFSYLLSTIEPDLLPFVRLYFRITTLALFFGHI